MSLSRTAYFLDFDHTLFNTDEFFHVDVRRRYLEKVPCHRHIPCSSFDSIRLEDNALE